MGDSPQAQPGIWDVSMLLQKPYCAGDPACVTRGGHRGKKPSEQRSRVTLEVAGWTSILPSGFRALCRFHNTLCPLPLMSIEKSQLK